MNYKKLSMNELKDYCKKNNLSTDGKKDDLIKRLSNMKLKSSVQLDLNNPSEDLLSFANPKNNKETLFIHLKVSNLSFYFNSATIYPLSLEDSTIYKNENRKKDIFNEFPEYIILSKGPINSYNDDDVLVEIATDNLQIETSIKSLAFRTASIRSSFISSIKTFPDSFIPEKICTISQINLKIIEINFEEIKSQLRPNIYLNDWKRKLQKFDRIMGMFSFMKNAGLFFSEKENIYQEYTINYFGALNLINTNTQAQPTRDIGLYKYILFPLDMETSNIQRVLFKQIIDSIYQDKNFDLGRAIFILREALNSNIASPDETNDLVLIMDYIYKLEQHQVSFKDLLTIDVIRKNYPVLALLFLSRFSNKSRQHTDKQAVRITFMFESYFNKSLTEYLMAVLGLYYGYKTMIKLDTNLKFSDNEFESLSNQQQSIKFKLTSNLDRITIQSIFDFCKSDKPISNNYTFLYSDFDKGVQIMNMGKTSMYDYLDKSYYVHNTKITTVERKNKAEKFIDIIDRFYSNKISSDSFLYHYLTSMGIDKKILIDLLKSNIANVNSEMVAQLIELDQRVKNKK
jgi:hypothetical protein